MVVYSNSQLIFGKNLIIIFLQSSSNEFDYFLKRRICRIRQLMPSNRTMNLSGFADFDACLGAKAANQKSFSPEKTIARESKGEIASIVATRPG